MRTMWITSTVTVAPSVEGGILSMKIRENLDISDAVGYTEIVICEEGKEYPSAVPPERDRFAARSWPALEKVVPEHRL